MLLTEEQCATDRGAMCYRQRGNVLLTEGQWHVLLTDGQCATDRGAMTCATDRGAMCY